MSVWTAADQAELDVLLWALVDGYQTHRQQCARCALEYPPCPHAQKAIQEVCDWHHMRSLLSKAQHLRARLEPAA